MSFYSKEAAVFFVDILGMSALTQKTINLDNPECKIDSTIYTFEAGMSGESFSSLNQRVAAWTLQRFRELLVDISKKYNLEVSQTSDCAFLWSENIGDLLMATSELMWKATLSGLLCRGGLSYGEIIVPKNHDRSMGSFVLGEAVTRAASYESKGKGCRVFTDDDSIRSFHMDFPGRVEAPHISSEMHREIFCPIVNPLNFDIVDEFKWYIYYDMKGIISSKKLISDPTGIDREKMAAYMCGLISVLSYSPNYAWNCLSEQGLIHVAASIEAISSSISIHTDSDNMKVSVEALKYSLSNTGKSYETIRRHYKEYSIDLIPEKVLKEHIQESVLKEIESINNVKADF